MDTSRKPRSRETEALGFGRDGGGKVSRFCLVDVAILRPVLTRDPMSQGDHYGC